MRERLRARCGRAFAFVLAASASVALASSAVTPAIAATTSASSHASSIAGAVKPLGSSPCVAVLRESHTGSGASRYMSRYVTDGAYGYGQWRAGAFGGQSLWKKRQTQWCKTETGLVTLDRATIVRFGVPAVNARRLVAKMHAVGDIAPAIAPTPFAPLGPAKHR